MSRELFKRGAPQSRVSWAKNRPRNRDWKRISLTCFKISLAASLLAAAVWAGPILAVSLRGLLQRQEPLSARKLILEGNRLVTREEILSALGIDAGDNLMEIDLARMAMKLEALPAVKRAVVRKQYPSAIYARITERRPLFIAGGEEPVLVDDEGVVMGVVEPGIGGLPVVAGLSLGGRRFADSRGVRIVSELREASLAAGLGWPGPFNLLDLTRPDCPVAFLGGKLPVLLGGGGYREKVDHLASLLPQCTGGSVNVSYIDLRFDSRVVVGTNPENPDMNNAQAQEKEVG